MPPTPPTQIQFTDGAAYERYMGHWSQLAGQSFLDWLSPTPNLRWLDIGCGNGAFTQLLLQRCAPKSVHGIDPSTAQLAYAAAHITSPLAHFQPGDAMNLPFKENTFDTAIMPLVIFFIPDPAKGVSEMSRILAPGGLAAAYAWDMLAGGFPYDTLWTELRAMNIDVPLPPSPDASRIEVLHRLWSTAGLTKVETRQITVQHTFPNFDDYWLTILGGPSVGPKLAAISPTDTNLLQSRLRSRLPTDPSGQITCTAVANAVKGYAPA